MPDEPVFKPEDLATPPSCPPLVGGFGAETPEVKKAREEGGGVSLGYPPQQPGETSEAKTTRPGLSPTPEKTTSRR